MELLVAEVIARFLPFLWPMIRISALLLAAPIFAVSAFNVRLRVLLALVLTFLIYPLYEWPFVDPFSAAGLREVFVQASVGAVMGLKFRERHTVYECITNDIVCITHNSAEAPNPCTTD